MKTYFAAFIPQGGEWEVLFADFELAAQGSTLDEAFFQAESALKGRVASMLEDKEKLPPASNIEKAKEKIGEWCRQEGVELPEGTLFQLIPCEVKEPTLVRVNVSFPSTVLERIDAKASLAGMTRSRFLAAAAQAWK